MLSHSPVMFTNTRQMILTDLTEMKNFLRVRPFIFLLSNFISLCVTAGNYPLAVHTYTSFRYCGLMSPYMAHLYQQL